MFLLKNIFLALAVLSFAFASASVTPDVDCGMVPPCSKRPVPSCQKCPPTPPY